MSAMIILGVKRGDGVVEGASQDYYPAGPDTVVAPAAPAQPPAGAV
jgi:hypothetical protein